MEVTFVNRGVREGLSSRGHWHKDLKEDGEGAA